MKIKYIIPVLLLSLIFVSCSKHEQEPVQKPQFDVIKSSNVPSYIGKNAYTYVEKQVSFGPRNPGSAGHKLALNYLKNELTKYADGVKLQNFSYPGYNETLDLSNIIAEFNPNAKNRIMLAAHWDTRPRAEESKDTSKQSLPILGANDGGSGVGVLLELARVLKEKKIDYGIDIVLLDGEDYGKKSDLGNYCLGAKYFAANLGDYKPAFGILLDMVGDKEASFPKEGQSINYAPDIVNMIWGMANQIGAGTFSNADYPEIYDDHVALNQGGIRTVDIIDIELIGADTPDPRRNYWHTNNDTMENISAETLQQVGDVLVNIIYSLKFNQ
jgi:glutaminyl-peptide cyclotransferase